MLLTLPARSGSQPHEAHANSLVSNAVSFSTKDRQVCEVRNALVNQLSHPAVQHDEAFQTKQMYMKSIPSRLPSLFLLSKFLRPPTILNVRAARADTSLLPIPAHLPHRYLQPTFVTRSSFPSQPMQLAKHPCSPKTLSPSR